MRYKDMKILIVDDAVENIRIVTEALKPLGTKFLYAKNGEEGLKRLENEPDLILLDIMMPVLNGFDTCKIIKNNPNTKDIPIIFLSSFNATEDIVQGFEMGAVDYISKPFQSSELIARVKTHLKLVHLMDQNMHNAKYATMSKLASGLIHEINTPLTPIKGSIEMMKLDIDSLKDSHVKKYLSVELESIETNIIRIQKLSNSISQLSQDTDEKFENSDIYKVLLNSLILLYNTFKDTIHVYINGELFTLEYQNDHKALVMIQHYQISQVFVEVLKNSIDAIQSNNIEEGIIDITLKENENIEIIIEDNGLGVSDEKLRTIFQDPLNRDKLFGGMGLGLFVSNKIVKQHKGTIEAENGKNGLRIKMKLPIRNKV